MIFVFLKGLISCMKHLFLSCKSRAPLVTPIAFSITTNTVTHVFMSAKDFDSSPLVDR